MNEINNEKREKNEKFNNINNYSKRESNEYKIKLVSLSPKKANIKKRLSVAFNRSNSFGNKDDALLKKIGLFDQNKYINLNIVKHLDKKNKKYIEEISILNKKNKFRDKNEIEVVINFLTKNNLREEVAKDLELFNISLKRYINFILDHITLKEYGYLDIIYYDKDNPKDFYFILNDSNVCEYTFDIIEDSLDFEHYLLYLNDLYKSYEKYKELKSFLQKLNIYQNQENSFVDSYLIKKIIDENNNVYSILSYNDIKEAKEILIKAKMYKFLLKQEENQNKEGENEENQENEENEEKKEENKYKKFNEEIIQIHKDYDANIDILNFDKVINEEISYYRYLTSFKNSIIKDSSIKHYINLLNNNNKNNIKKIKYQKVKTYKKFEFFGNFDYSTKTKNPIKRKLIARSEINSTLVLCFNKSVYYHIITSALKEEIAKNIIYFHDEYIFKQVNMEYFTKKVFAEFKLNSNFKGDKIFIQNKKNNSLIMLKDGIIELQMQNITLSELGKKISDIRDLLIKKRKQYKMNQNKLLDSVLDLEVDTKTNLQKNLIKKLIKEKINIIFSRCTKGFFGEYECFFNIPSLLTGVVVSDNSEEYIYSFEKFKDLNVHSSYLIEKLKEYSFNKLINILKRMYSIYNSYWRILNDKYENLSIEIDNNNNNKIIDGENNKKDLFSINNKNNLNDNYDNYYKIDQYDYKKLDSKSNIEITKLKLSNPIISKTIFTRKMKDFINNNLETMKLDKLTYKNKVNQISEKKIKIKQWDFSEHQKKYNFFDKLQSINFKKSYKLITNKKNDSHKKFDITKSSYINNNLIKSTINQVSKSVKIRKLKKNILRSIFLPPISFRNENNTENFNYHIFTNINNTRRNNTNVEESFNNNTKENNENKYHYSNREKKRKKINFDIKKVGINFLKQRKKKGMNTVENNNNESNISYEEYYFINQ